MKESSPAALLLLVLPILILTLGFISCKGTTDPDPPVPTKGKISVTSTPSGAQVFLDGTDSGKVTTCTLDNISPGSHTVLVKKDGYADGQSTVTVTAGQTANINIVLSGMNITITNPTAATAWKGGDQVNVQWQTAASIKAAATVLDIANVKIELLRGGGSLRTIVEQTPNAGSYQWTVPYDLETGVIYQVKVACSTDATIFGTSQNFAIERLALTVTEPAASDSWKPGSTEAITWSSNFSGSGNVRIDLYAGSALANIVSSAPNSGSYNWAIPASQAEGTDYKIRVTWLTETSIFGESGVFSIENDFSITVTKPAPGEALLHGLAYDILWTTTASPPGNARIELYKGGSLAMQIVSSTANSGSFANWPVPNSLSNGDDYQIKVTWLTNTSVNGLSGYFSIRKPTITITQPTAAASWNKGQTYSITWTSDVLGSGLVALELYRGVNLITTISAGAANDGSLNWLVPLNTLPDGEFSDYWIRATWSTDTTVYGESPNFTITPGGTITVATPAAGTTWYQQLIYNITWVTTLPIPNYVDVDLYKGAGLTPVLSVANSTLNDGVLAWKIPGGLVDGTDYRIKVAWAPDASAFGESSAFPIMKPTITVTQPTAGAIWTRGSTRTLTWTSEVLGNGQVTIRLIKGADIVLTISMPPNSGSYQFYVPASAVEGTDYKIRVSWDSDSTVFGESGVFTISN